MTKFVLMVAVVMAQNVMAESPCKNPNVIPSVVFSDSKGYYYSGKTPFQSYDQNAQQITITPNDVLAKNIPTDILKAIRKFHEEVCSVDSFSAAVNQFEYYFETGKPYVRLTTSYTQNTGEYITNVSLDGVLKTGQRFTAYLPISGYGTKLDSEQIKNSLKYLNETVKSIKEKIANVSKPSDGVDEQKNKELLDGYSRGKKKDVRGKQHSG